LPDIEELLIPLEHVISRVFIPATLVKEKGASNWLTTIPSKEMGFDLNN